MIHSSVIRQGHFRYIIYFVLNKRHEVEVIKVEESSSCRLATEGQNIKTSAIHHCDTEVYSRLSVFALLHNYNQSLTEPHNYGMGH